jgi:hypothetical protein
VQDGTSHGCSGDTVRWVALAKRHRTVIVIFFEFSGGSNE